MEWISVPSLEKLEADILLEEHFVSFWGYYFWISGQSMF